MKLMIIGDTHGHANVIEDRLRRARSLGCNDAIVVGDFGLWPGESGVQFLDDVAKSIAKHEVDLYAVQGNHDDAAQWEAYTTGPFAKNEAGMVMVRRNLYLIPKVCHWTWDGKRFYVAGGAVSIDRRFRREGLSWWPNETLTDEQVENIEKYKGPPVDYLFTHDASDNTVWPFNLVPDPDSSEHRKKIDRVIAALQPKMQWHGHMHCKVEWENRRSHGLIESAFGVDDRYYTGAVTHTFGLDCDAQPDSWGILDTKTDTFTWATDIKYS